MTLYGLYHIYNDYQGLDANLRGLFETQDEAEKVLSTRVEEYAKFLSEIDAIESIAFNTDKWNYTLNTWNSPLDREDHERVCDKRREEQKLISEKYQKFSIYGKTETMEHFIIRPIETGTILDWPTEWPEF